MSPRPNPALTIYIDGSSRGNPGPSGIGVAVFAPGDISKPLAEISRYIGMTTNNVAEYEALIHALRWLLHKGEKNCTIKMDSELVYRQLSGHYRIRKIHIAHQMKRVQRLLEQLGKIDFILIDREKNKIANRLAQKASKKVERVEKTRMKNGKLFKDK